MLRSKIAGMGYYVPEQVVTNDDLARHMETSDAWVQERTGIQERRYAKRQVESTSTMGFEAAKKAIESAGITANDVDFIIFATLSPDYYFPGCGVLIQRMLGISGNGVGALDIRNQCSGFVYGLSIADNFVKTGQYKNVLLVGAEMHSFALDFSTRGRNVTVIFGDGAGAAIIQPTEDENEAILSTHLHADGREAEQLAVISPGAHGGVHDDIDHGFPTEEEKEYGGMFVTKKQYDEQVFAPYMNGPHVFKYAVRKFPEVIMEALKTNGYKPSDIDMLVPHQANLRISQFVQRTMRLSDDQVFNNIQKYGNTTAASIPIAMCEAIEQGKIKKGDLVCLAAFGSGFTWGSALMRWAY